MATQADRTHTGQRFDCLMLCALYRRTLRISCRKCHHVALWDAVPIWWLFEKKGWRGFLNDVPRRLVCSQCWAERHDRVRGPRVVVTEEPPGKTPHPYPTESEWKRFVSRYRS